MSKQGRKPKFDYDADELYDEIFALAFNGATDREIPTLLIDKFGTTISGKLFDFWKAGTYNKWTETENKRRSTRLVGVLARARTKSVMALKNAYFKMALGKVKTKNKGTVRKHLVINGVQTEDELVQVSENEVEYAPSLQAISTLLYHYDPEWRKMQKGIEEAEDGIPRNIEHGVPIDAWIRREAEVEDSENRQKAEK